jgi:predicted amidohydrolase YtcJ
MRPLLFRNGRFLAPGEWWGAIGDLLVEDGRIRSFGPALPLPAGAVEIDLGGRSVIPGPVDAHCHLVSFGLQESREADLRGAASLEEMVARLRAHARRIPATAGRGAWLLGRGFDQELLPERRWPTRHDLDRISTELPIRIIRICGHALVANTLALQLAGLDPETPRAGFPDGVLTEEAMAPIRRAVPPPGDGEWLAAARTACNRAVRAGFVGVHSLMANAEEVRALVELHRQRLLPLRVVLQLPFHLLEHARSVGLKTGFGDDFLSIGAVKLFSDGSLGARTAALKAPYSDDPSTSGELIYTQQELNDRVAAIYRAGFQSCIHAIGDAALEVTLNAVQAGAASLPAAEWARLPPPRIEHASLVDPALVQRMRQLQVGAAIQPQFAWSDQWVPERLGRERSRGCYAFRTLWEAGIPLAGSTDCPVERLDALAAIGDLVHRPPWLPEGGVPLDTALRIFSEGAYALRGLPATRGRLRAGAAADFVVLAQHPDQVAPTEIRNIPVALTVVDGEVRFAAE